MGAARAESGFIGAISIDVDGLSLTRRTRRVYDRALELAPWRASIPTPRDYLRRFPAFVLGTPGRDRDGPRRPGAPRQPFQPASLAAALPVAEGRLPRQLRRARDPAHGLLRRLVRGTGCLGLR